jgi:hypothetical protein
VIEAVRQCTAVIFFHVVAKETIGSCGFPSAIFKVADKARIIDDSDVLPHGNTGMAGCTPEDLAPLELLEMGCMIETDIAAKGHSAV